MKLELKHITPYLPYGLKCVFTQDLRDDFHCEEWLGDIEIMNKGSIWQYAGYTDEDLSIPLGEGDFNGFLIRNGFTYTSVGNSVKPILKPLSKLTNELDNLATDVVKFLVESSKLPFNSSELLIKGLMYSDVVILLENHYDIFGLIEKGLAVDFNTLK